MHCQPYLGRMALTHLCRDDTFARPDTLLNGTDDAAVCTSRSA